MGLKQSLIGLVEPDSPEWASAPAALRRAYYEESGRLALQQLAKQLGKGIGANGRAMKARIRAILPDGADGPVMEPHYDASRVITLADYKSTDKALTIFWHAGSGHTSHRIAKKKGKKATPFGTILQYHADGLVRGVPVRDVRLSKANIAVVKLRMKQWWASRQPKPKPKPKPAPVKPKPKPGRGIPVGRGPHVIDSRDFRSKLAPKPGVGPKPPPPPPPPPVKPPPPPPPPVKPPPPPPPPVKPPPPPPPPVKPPPPPPPPVKPPPPPPPPVKPPPPPPPPVKPPPPPPVKPPTGPILPGRPIADRLAAYSYGDMKVSRLAAIGARKAAIESRDRELRSELETRPDATRVRAIYEELSKIQIQRKASIAQSRAEVESILAQEPSRGLAFEYVSMSKTQGDLGSLDPLTPAMQSRADEAARWFGRFMAGPGPFRIGIGKIPASQEQRAFYSVATDRVAVTDYSSVGIYVHEIAHGLEYNLPGSGSGGTIREVVQDFLRYRVGYESTQRLNQVFPGSGYGDDEVGRKDQFDRVFPGSQAYYVGKRYDSGATEAPVNGPPAAV